MHLPCNNDGANDKRYRGKEGKIYVSVRNRTVVCTVAIQGGFAHFPLSAFLCQIIMHKKPLILTCTGIVLIIAFFLLPRYQKWAGTVYSYWTDYQWQRDNTDLETRMTKRFGNSYTYSKHIAEALEKKGVKDKALVLMPPGNYFTKMGLSYHVPEPAVFYYYTGLKTIWANSNDAIKANWYVRVSGKELIIDSVRDLNAFGDTIAAFKKLRPSL